MWHFVFHLLEKGLHALSQPMHWPHCDLCQLSQTLWDVLHHPSHYHAPRLLYILAKVLVAKYPTIWVLFYLFIFIKISVSLLFPLPPLFAYDMYYMHSHTLHRYIRNLHTCLVFLLLLPIYNQNTRVFKNLVLVPKVQNRGQHCGIADNAFACDASIS